MNISNTVKIKNNYAEILSAMGNDLQSAADTALQRYLIELITGRIAELRKKETDFQNKYGCDYPTFSRRTAEDEEFVVQVEKNLSKLWELDQAEWEFCHKGIEDWTKKLQNILLMS
ncbi:MAG: hypothetical protein GY795_07680 [Desulfobacterales bacterium]|nr:hypothetical protein [Desulfobacterales bacterium]